MLGDANDPAVNSLFGIPIIAAYHLPKCPRCNCVVYLSTGAMRLPDKNTAVVLAVCVSCKTGYKMRIGGKATPSDHGEPRRIEGDPGGSSTATPSDPP